MALYFNAPKDGEKFSTIAGSLENSNTKLVFSEARIQKLEDGTYKLFMKLEDATDVTNVNDRNWKFSPCLASIALHSTEYDKRKKVGDEWKSEKAKPSAVEAFFCEQFELNSELFLNDDAGFKGMIHLWDNQGTFDAIRTGKQPDGSPIPQAGLDYVKSAMFNVTPCEIEELKDLPAAAVKKSWGGGGKGQTEAERLKERHAGLLAFMNEMGMAETKPFETLKDIHGYLSLYSDEPEKQAETALALLRVVMG